MTEQFRPSRRSLAKGAAWAVPVVAFAGAAPAFAASRDTFAGGVCEIFYGGGSVSNQRMDVYLSIDSTASVIPAGTTVTWTVTLDGSTGYTQPSYLQVPNLNYSSSNSWTLSTSQPAGTNITSGSSFTVTWKAVTDVDAAAFRCGADANNGSLPKLIWPDSGGPMIGTGVTVTVASTTSVPAGQGTGESGSLKWKVPRRISTSTRTSMATEYISKLGAQKCYPLTKYSFVSGTTAAQGTNGSNCGDGGNNSSTRYPDGTCRKVNITSGQATIPAVC